MTPCLCGWLHVKIAYSFVPDPYSFVPDKHSLAPHFRCVHGVGWAEWLQEDTAVQRAKRALKAQLKLRGQAAGRAQALRDAREEERAAAAADADAHAGESGGGDEGDDDGQKAELQDLEERVATASKVGGKLSSGQRFLPRGAALVTVRWWWLRLLCLSRYPRLLSK